MKYPFQAFSFGLVGVCLSSHLVAAGVDVKQSLVSIVTFKEGLASSLAHNHFIVAPTPTVEGDVNAQNIEVAHLSITFPVTSLEVDAPKNYDTWLPALTKQNVLTEASKISESDRKVITSNMLADDQLHAAAFPTIAGTLDHLTLKSNSVWEGHLELTVHGEKVARTVILNVEGDSALINEAYQFTEFKISPYSAMLGAIRVKDTFRLFVKLVFSAQSHESKGEKS